MKLHITFLLFIIAFVNLNSRNLQTEADSLTTTDHELPEVKVSARKKLIRITPEGIVYSMKDDRTVGSESLLHALRNVPLVTVDGTDNIRISGSTSFSIYLNGKPFKLADTNRKETLRSIPANIVKSIEIVTNPDARYDADAGTAVLNIITEKHALDGYQLGITGEGNTIPQANGGISIVASKGKCNLLLGYNYDFTRHADQPIYLYRSVYNEEKEEISNLKSENKNGWNNFHNHIGHGIMEIELDSLNQLYADAHVLFNRQVSENTNHKTFMADGYMEHSRLRSLNDFCSGAFEGNLIYRKLYKKDKSEQFSFGYRYSYNPDQRYDIAEDSISVSGTAVPEITKTKIDTRSEGGLNEHTFLCDFRVPLLLHTFRVGAKVILRRSNSTPTYRFWDYESMSWINETPYGNEVEGQMRQQQDIVSTYATYTLKTNHISLNVGGRYEYSYDRIKFADNPENNLCYNHSDFMPRGSLSYAVSSQMQVVCSYSMGIIRPSIWTMNPYRSQPDSYNARYGTPDLKTEHRHITNISLMYNRKNVFTNLKIEYVRSSDAIMEYPLLGDDSRLLCFTYMNIDRHEKTGISAFVGCNPTDFMSFSLGGNASFHSMSSQKGGTMHRWSYAFYVSCHANIREQWALGCNYGLFCQPPSFHSYYNNLCMYSFYVRRQFLGKRLNIGLTINNPFGKYSKAKYNSFGDSFRNTQYNYIKSRSLCVSLAYRFGKGKNVDVKRNKSLKNSDMNEDTGVNR